MPDDGSPLDAPAELRDKLVLALDVDDGVAAGRLARELRPWFGSVKIGLELFCAAGPDVVVDMVDDGFRVFLDLKLADIPNTVGRAAKVLGALGATWLTVHASAGIEALAAGVEGLAAGASGAGLDPPGVLAVTVLTSEATVPPGTLSERVSLAVGAGCAGVVCAAGDLPEVKLAAPHLLTVVPGIRPAGVPAGDQRRVATPSGAFAAGADLIVVGRAVTGSDDRQAAAEALVSEVLEGR